MPRLSWLRGAATVVAPIAAAVAQPADTASIPYAPVGAATVRVELDSVDLTAVTTLSELLQARVPGLVVRSSSGSVGSAADLLLRGRKGAFGSTSPLLVLDGVRIAATPRGTALDVGVGLTRLDDIPLEQIATIEVLPGPAAAARLGIGASAGAIVVTTRRGGAGQRARRAFVEGGVALVSDSRLAGVVAVNARSSPPTALCFARSSCPERRIVAFDPVASAPLSAAPRWRAGARATGGGDRVAWAAGADGQRLGGVLDGNTSEHGALRANLDLHPARSLDVALGGSAVDRRVALWPYDLASFARPLSSVLVRDSVQPNAGAPVTQRAHRIDLSGTASWRPREWMQARLVVGNSLVAARERSPRSVFGPSGSGSSISIEKQGDDHDRLTTTALTVVADDQLGALRSTTTLGVERITGRYAARGAVTTFVGADGALPSASVQQWYGSAHIDALVGSERLAFGRWSADGTVRVERIPGLPAGHRRATDASASLRWAAVRRPDLGLELHAAAGAIAGGYEFGALDAAPLPPGASPSLPSRPRTREAELGVEASAGHVLVATVSAYGQRTSDAAFATPLSPSAGFGGLALAVGEVRNAGVEGSLRAHLVERPALGVVLGARAWGNRNRIHRLSGANFVSSPTRGTSRVTAADRPVIAYWAAPIAGYVDANRDGLLVESEVQPGSAAYAGTSDAPRAGSVDLAVRMGRLAFWALAEHRGGMVATGARPTEQYGNARAVFDPAAPLDEQARYVAAPYTEALPLERASFTRLRELAVSATLPRAFGRAGTTFTVAARNLVTWTGYSGSDPEGDQPGRTAILAQPLPPTIALRVTTAW